MNPQPSYSKVRKGGGGRLKKRKTYTRRSSKKILQGKIDICHNPPLRKFDDGKGPNGHLGNDQPVQNPPDQRSWFTELLMLRDLEEIRKRTQKKKKRGTFAREKRKNRRMNSNGDEDSRSRKLG